MTEPKVVPIDRAAIMAGMAPRTLRRRVAAGELATLIDPRDKRRKLVRVADIQRFLGELPMRNAS